MSNLFLNGAVAHLQAACDAGVEVCFANPGTTEMPMVAALDTVSGMRPVLGLFEGVCTGAADGYGRMLGRPALTMLHLGPGFANGIANLHNARRARTPIVNVIGDHATWHLPFDAPLTSDIDSLARPVSAWVRHVDSASDAARDTRDAVRASMELGGSATLVFPVDAQQAACDEVAAGLETTRPDTSTRTAPSSSPNATGRATADATRGQQVDAIARRLKEGVPAVLLLGGNALHARGQRAAARIAARCGATLFSETFPARAERGGGLPDIDRLPYYPEPAIAALEGRVVVLAGAIAPVAYFGYPGLPSRLAPLESLRVLGEPGDDNVALLEALAEALGATEDVPGKPQRADEQPTGPLTPQHIGRILSNLLPEGAIVSVEGGTCGYPFVTASAHAARHTILTNTGGAIGQGLPVAFGAAIACPERRVVALQSDGSAYYTIQTLWSMAREQSDVTVLIASNRRYGILQTELRRAGVETLGPKALQLTEFAPPGMDWRGLARGFGMEAESVSDGNALAAALERCLSRPGPRLVEMVL